MTEPVNTAKSDPETFVLRAKPRSVTRFKAQILIAASAIACIAVACVMWLGLKGPSHKAPDHHTEAETDKAFTTHTQSPERVQALPKSYADIPAAVPQLGAPLPGDLGGPILEHQRSQGLGANQGLGMGQGTSALVQRTDSFVDAQSNVNVPMSGLFFKVSDTRHSQTEAGSPNSHRTDHGQMGLIPLDSGSNLDPDKYQNGQIAKLRFMSQSRSSYVNPHNLQKPVSPNTVLAGTVISASLITGLNSDLPGMVIAQVTDNVYDSVTGKILLIPQGSRLIGSYDSVIAYGQSRALVVWQRLIRPDGTSLEIDNLPATDAQGFAGLKDSVDYHTGSLLKGVGLSTLLGIAGQSGSDSDKSDLIKAVREATAQAANQAGQKIVEKSLTIQPSLTVRPGWPLRVIVHKDLILSPYHF